MDRIGAWTALAALALAQPASARPLIDGGSYGPASVSFGCASTGSPVPLGALQRRARSCSAKSSVAIAAHSLRVFGKAFPGVLAALDRAGVRAQISRTPPSVCTVTVLEREGAFARKAVRPHSHGGGHGHPGEEHSHGPAYAEAAGLYCGDQKIAWAGTDFPASVIAELFHAVDEAALKVSPLRPSEEAKEALEARFGEPPLQYYGFSKSSIDPSFYAMWASYRRRTGSCADPRGLLLGCQGGEMPIELFMELGNFYFNLALLDERKRSPKLRRLTADVGAYVKSLKRQKARLRRAYPGLFGYFESTVASILPRSQTPSLAWRLRRLEAI